MPQTTSYLFPPLPLRLEACSWKAAPLMALVYSRIKGTPPQSPLCLPVLLPGYPRRPRPLTLKGSVSPSPSTSALIEISWLPVSTSPVALLLWVVGRHSGYRPELHCSSRTNKVHATNLIIIGLCFHCNC